MKTPQPVDWTVVAEANGVGFRWGYSGDDLVAEWIGILRLHATRTGELKAIQVAPDAPDALVEKTRLGLATAFLRARRNLHALHASAVSVQGKALVCVGASGLGKSTMADRMCRRQGVDLLGDDITGIEVSTDGELLVSPSESAVWLATDGGTVKAPVSSCATATCPAPLSCIASLVFDDAASALELRELRGVDAVSALLPALVRFETAPALWARELDFVGMLVSQSRIVQAKRSRDVPADRVADALLQLVTYGDR